MIFSSKVRWALSIALALFITVVPTVYYRMVYTHQKRLRVVTPGWFYRSGAMSAPGLEEAIRIYGIRTVINLMEEAPDPIMHEHYFAPGSIKESELVPRCGARYVTLTLDVVPKNRDRITRPQAIEDYLAILDDPSNYPVLVHCKAGLHRTGVMAALYRMEYEGWTAAQALGELRRNGFGEFVSTSANAYIQQYVLGYRPHQREGRVVERVPGTPAHLMARPNIAAPTSKD